MRILAGLASCFLATLARADDEVGFNRDVHPILAANCFPCHGPDPIGRKEDLRFDRETGFFGNRKGGPVVVRGKPEASPLYQRIMHADPDEVMPPPESKKSLSAADKELLRRWIAQGAPWQPHWSFIKPERPSLPRVKNDKWVRNPLDRFVLARLEAEGLSPAPEADRRALARRLSLDLTGLPPEPEAVESFVTDRSARAYEKLVDGMMESERYGEHRARAWLDAARYADTHGLHFDNYREIWPYRDWVIGAFNRNLPFDRFTVEQLAGDLLPDASQDQIVATGFHRCNMTTNEGGTIAAETLAYYARERVETTSWVWLGLTANCAVCHEHKFDPITTKDFYSMSAFFRNTTQSDKDGNVKNTKPVFLIPREGDQERTDEIAREIEGVRKTVEERRRTLRAGFESWLTKAKVSEWNREVSKIGDPDFHLPLGPETVVDGKKPIRPEGDVGDLEKDDAFSYGCRFKSPKNFNGTGAILARMDDTAGYRGWDLWTQKREFGAHFIHTWPGDAIKVVTTGRKLIPGRWQHVMVTYDGSRKAEGFRIYVDGKAANVRFEANKLRNTTRTKTPFLIGRRKTQSPLVGVGVQDVRIYRRRLTAAEVGRLASHDRVKRLLALPPEKRSKKDKDALFEARASGDGELASARERLAKLQAEKKSIRGRSVAAHVMEEKRGAMPMANVLYRGQYDKPREKVGAAVFSALHPMEEGLPKNRLGLAKWITSKENPLTPRVTVNRFWQEVFGTGIVETAEDFGIMGSPPSHPEMLDWLAVTFREDPDVKKLFRLIVTSATYRQSAATTPAKIAKDPGNRLFSRGPRFRMDAEMIRDTALAAGGLLSPTLGGPSVKPYQPGGVWASVAMPESNTKLYRRGSGSELYRRSLYTFWKRAAPPASMEILNAPSREVSCLRRDRTNTPLQALVTLNDPQFVEAARALAVRALKAARDDAGRLDFVARRVLSRPLSPDEAGVVSRMTARLRKHYRASPKDAAALLAVGESKADGSLDAAELASWTMVCNQMLNLDEALNK